MGGGASKVVDTINPAKYIEQGRKEMEKSKVDAVVMEAAKENMYLEKRLRRRH